MGTPSGVLCALPSGARQVLAGHIAVDNNDGQTFSGLVKDCTWSEIIGFTSFDGSLLPDKTRKREGGSPPPTFSSWLSDGKGPLEPRSSMNYKPEGPLTHPS